MKYIFINAELTFYATLNNSKTQLGIYHTPFISGLADIHSSSTWNGSVNDLTSTSNKGDSFLTLLKCDISHILDCIMTCNNVITQSHFAFDNHTLKGISRKDST